MRTKTRPFDPAEHLATPEAQAEYISAALGTGAPAFIADSLGAVARARGMSQLARDTGLRRESLQSAVCGRQPGVRHDHEGRAGAGRSGVGIL
jgi:probable addiction module antidote protein